MSTPPKKPVPPRRVSANPPSRESGSAGASKTQSSREGATSSQRTSSSRNAPPQQSRQRSQQSYRQEPQQRSRRQVNYYEDAPRRDPFPILMGGIVGALVMGLILVIFLLTQNNNSTTAPVSNPGNVPGASDGASTPASVVQPGTTPIEPDRMTIAEFKALYADPAKRPVVLDVRSKQSFDEGHITGSINVPVVETDARIAEIPKDKLVVAYCQ